MFGLSLTSTVKNLKAELSSAKARIGDKDAVIAGKDALIAAHLQTISGLKTAEEKLKSDLSDTQHTLDCRQQELVDSRSQCYALENEIERLKVSEAEVRKLRGKAYFTKEYKEILAKFFSDDRTPIFVSGPAGTGKSSLIRLACDIFMAAHPSRAIQVVAPTGIAAQNIPNGRTIHSFFRFDPGEWKPVTGYKIGNPGDESAISTIRRTNILIVDEVSMLSPSMVDAIDDALRYLNDRPEDPFGCAKVVFVGDLAQLPPVYDDKDKENNRREYGNQEPHFFDAHVLRHIKCEKCNLTTIFRQTEEDFIKALLELREGNVSQVSACLFDKRYTENPVPPDRRTTLVPTNARADKLNDQALEALPGDPVVFETRTQGHVSDSQMASSKYPQVLQLKIGARVMLLKNSLPTYCNGTIGTVWDITEEIVTVEATDGRTFRVGRDVIEFTRNQLNKNTDLVERIVVGSISQFPMKLAWGITIHKGQGQTLDDVYVDLNGIFAEGQAYTALSRVRTKAGLHLLNHFNASQVISNPSVLRWL